MSPETKVNTHDTVRERSDTSRIVSWLLLSGNRVVIAAMLAFVFFAIFTAAVHIIRPSLFQVDAEGDLAERLFSTMIIVIVTGTTLVVTFGQLILTQENGPLGDQLERLDGAMEFREGAAKLIGKPCSTVPSVFLGEILGATAERARRIGDFDDTGNAQLNTDLADLSKGTIENADSVMENLDGAEFGTFDVVSAVMNFDYSWKVFQVERLMHEYGDDLTDEQTAAMGEFKSALMLYGPAREYIKTLYFQWTLIELSQVLLATTVPALLIAGVGLVTLDGKTFPAETFDIENIIPVMGLCFALTLFPFMIFITYIFRIFTVAKRTLAIDPLIPRRT